MGPVVPFLPLISTGIGALFGRKKNAAQQQLQALSGKQMAFGDTMTGLSGSALGAVNEYLTPLVRGDQNALAKATASTNADLASQIQTLTNRTVRGGQRGAVTAMQAGSLPQLQMAQGLRNRIGAQQNAVQMLGQVGLGEGGLGNQAYGGAAGSATSGGQIGLTQTAMDRDYWGGLGEGVVSVLTGKVPGGEGTLLDRILSIFRKKGSAGASPTGPGTIGSGAPSGTWTSPG